MPLMFLTAADSHRLARLLRGLVPPDPDDRRWVDAFVTRLEDPDPKENRP